jgi:hypothetical protein
MLASAAVAVLAFGAAPAKAADNVAAVGHISASVGSTLAISETTPIRFGNFTAVCAASNCDGTGFITLNNLTSVRTTSGAVNDVITLLHGANGANGVPGDTDAINGSATVGVYHIAGVTGGAVAGTANIYITFSDGLGNMITTQNGIQNNAQTVTLADAQNATGHFDVDTFTWDSSGNDPVYGDFITTAGGVANIHLGATLHTDAAATVYADGAYTGTFNIMASY